MLATESKLPVQGGPAKRAYVRGMFAAIAPTYDRLNRLLSLRFDQRWRRRAVASLNWERIPRGRYLDLCAGTLDFAAILSAQRGFNGRVVGADFVPAMLRQGRSKSDRILPLAADALELPFESGLFDGVMVGWGLRNLVELDVGLREIARVLRPGARVVAVETGTPDQEPMRTVFNWYFNRLLPRIGRLVSHHDTAYDWLPESARGFPPPDVVVGQLRDAGFRDVTASRFMWGVTTLFVGTRS